MLRSLGWLARGLSALFWGLPVALIICAETARASWLKPLGMLPALFATGLLLYGLWQMGHFQQQERPWRSALDRAACGEEIEAPIELTSSSGHFFRALR